MKIEVYIARDKDGRLFMHFSEPVIDNISGDHWQSFPYLHMLNIDNTPLSDEFKKLTFENSPVKLNIKKAAKK